MNSKKNINFLDLIFLNQIGYGINICKREQIFVGKPVFSVDEIQKNTIFCCNDFIIDKKILDIFSNFNDSMSIITLNGGITSHPSIVALNFNINCIIGFNNFYKLQNYKKIAIHFKNKLGDLSYVYDASSFKI